MSSTSRSLLTMFDEELYSRNIRCILDIAQMIMVDGLPEARSITRRSLGKVNRWRFAIAIHRIMSLGRDLQFNLGAELLVSPRDIEPGKSLLTRQRASPITHARLRKSYLSKYLSS